LQHEKTKPTRTGNLLRSGMPAAVKRGAMPKVRITFQDYWCTFDRHFSAQTSGICDVPRHSKEDRTRRRHRKCTRGQTTLDSFISTHHTPPLAPLGLSDPIAINSNSDEVSIVTETPPLSKPSQTTEHKLCQKTRGCASQAHK
jgi:hypothetical protein